MKGVIESVLVLVLALAVSVESRHIRVRRDTTDIDCSVEEDSEILHAHPTDCTLYIKCDNGVAVERPCAPGTEFSPTEQVCVFPEDSGCTASSDDDEEEDSDEDSDSEEDSSSDEDSDSEEDSSSDEESDEDEASDDTEGEVPEVTTRPSNTTTDLPTTVTIPGSTEGSAPEGNLTTPGIPDAPPASDTTIVEEPATPPAEPGTSSAPSTTEEPETSSPPPVVTTDGPGSSPPASEIPTEGATAGETTVVTTEVTTDGTTTEVTSEASTTVETTEDGSTTSVPSTIGDVSSTVGGEGESTTVCVVVNSIPVEAIIGQEAADELQAAIVRCFTQQSRVLIPVASECSKYIECDGGQFSIQTCEDGESFDATTAQCVSGNSCITA